ncbi:MAG: 16S rRNA (cytidine(1402)-2'-O)-methyltransferase [Syntrophales bacterium]|jgi:16S rRNA (cytidine1402-2'-O)-methyltransferase|nr:16S rRNA (cytidine(1402)-2'-O)-methyltransferase [Syntrophales bacterium]
MDKAGTLYVVATPIGNLEDITLRAIRILREVSLVAAEDTRRTRILLKHYDIRTPVTSLHEQNELSKTPFLLDKIKKGQDIACVTDAGTPAISDPGYPLIHNAVKAGIEVVPIPGVSAAITALSVSGLPMDHFVFQGFLPPTKGKKKAVLLSIADDRRTQIFYESPKRLLGTLKDIETWLGNRFVVVARELTKLHEEVVRGDVAEVICAFEGRVIKGEITLVVAGKKSVSETENPEARIQAMMVSLSREQGLSRRDMVDRITADLGFPRKMVYHALLRFYGGS